MATIEEKARVRVGFIYGVRDNYGGVQQMTLMWDHTFYNPFPLSAHLTDCNGRTHLVEMKRKADDTYQLELHAFIHRINLFYTHRGPHPSEEDPSKEEYIIPMSYTSGEATPGYRIPPTVYWVGGEMAFTDPVTPPQSIIHTETNIEHQYTVYFPEKSYAGTLHWMFPQIAGKQFTITCKQEGPHQYTLTIPKTSHVYLLQAAWCKWIQSIDLLWEMCWYGPQYEDHSLCWFSFPAHPEVRIPTTRLIPPS